MKKQQNLIIPSVALAMLASATFAAPDGADAPALPRDPDVQLKIGLQAQFRYTYTVAPDAPDPANDATLGFSFRRLRPSFDFRAYDGELRLYAQGDAPNAGNMRILELFAEHKLDDDWTIKGGQIRVAFNREMWVSSKKQQAVDRTSIANNINPGREDKIHAVELKYQAEPCRLFFTLGEGMDSAWKSYNGPGSQWSVTVRGEILLLGDNFKQFDQFTAPGGTNRGLLLGAAVHVQQTPNAGDRFAWTADLSYQDSGFNALLMGGGHVAEDRDSGASPEPESLYGVAGHIGFYVCDDVEPFVRYEWGTASDATHPDLNVVTAGVNWYIIGQALRFVADASWARDGVGPAFDRSSDGLLATPTGDNRFIFRAQMQFLF